MRRQFPHLSLIRWYRKYRRHLPWREDPTPYKVWISEIMLQQTQVKNVLPYYKRFVRRFPHLKSLSRATESEVLRLWSGLGYYTRAQNMLKTSRIVLKEFQGIFPNRLDDLIKLPGIGRYTAGAILSIAHNCATPILDGNVRRVLSRFFLANSEKALWKISNKILLRASSARQGAHNLKPSEFNQSLMELGALVCLPKNPLCSTCPIGHGCKAKKMNLQLSYPPLRKRNKTLHQHFVSALLFGHQTTGIPRKKFLIQQRSPRKKWLKGLWELPTIPIVKSEINSGKIKNRAEFFEMLSKRFSKKMGSEVRINQWLGQFSHTITFHNLKIIVTQGTIEHLNGAKHLSCRWITGTEIGKVPSSSMLQKSLALFSLV